MITNGNKFRTKLLLIVSWIFVLSQNKCSAVARQTNVQSAKVLGQAVATGWSAKWISTPWSTERDGAELDGSHPMAIFRREFILHRKPMKAVLRIVGLGQYEAHLNSNISIDAPHALHQAWTDYRKTVTFDTYDLTGKLLIGKNVLSVLLGNGMYNVQRTKGRYTKFEGSFGTPKLIAELRIEYEDGTSEVIASDSHWKVTKGPITFSSTYGGEDYDARLACEGWNSPGYDDATWDNATEVDGPGGVLLPAIAPSLHTSLLPLVPREQTIAPNKVVYDLGINFAGWPDVKVHGPAGAMLKLTPGELLKPDGSVSQTSSGGPQWWTFTLHGGRDEEWQPKFSYYGFRYIQAEWIGNQSNEAKILSLNGRELRSDSPVAGSFASSSEMLNNIHALIVQAMHNNEVSLFTDCPHREKLGWLEETHLVAAGLMFNNDLHGLYAATARNIADAQLTGGEVPTIAPQYTQFGPKYPIYDDSPEWGSATILAAWSAYQFYGDQAELQANYKPMQSYIQFLEGKAKDGIVSYGLGDWYDIGPGGPGVSKLTTAGVTGTLMLYQDAETMERIANLLGHPSDAAAFRDLAQREKGAFNKTFWNPSAGYYDKGSQTANAMPLALGIVPEEHKAQVLDHIVADIHSHNDHITTGEVGYPYLLRALMQANRDDVLLAMMLRKDQPSYGSQLAAGATSLTEAWDANPRSSQDHFMLGGAEEWFYRGLGGIDFDFSRPDAARRITIRPRIVDGITWVRCGYDSRLGSIHSNWKRVGTTSVIEITVPDNATIVVPLDKPTDAVTIDGKPAAQTSGVQALSHDATTATYNVQRGRYRFTVASTMK
jgi:alpha-L-rhamnosidase